MKKQEPGRTEATTHPETLLDLWMGDAEGTPRRVRKPISAPVVLLAVVGVLVAIGLAKYAVDVLAILAALVCVGLSLHVLGLRLAESELLSPAWLTIVLLGGSLIAYALFVPANSVAGLGQYMPKWMVAALEWSESKGWGQRVLIGPGESTAPSAPVVATSGPETRTPSSETAGSRTAPALVVSASSSTSLHGQPVTFMARLAVAEAAGGTSSARFYDGLIPLGTADLRAEGRTRIAYLTVRGLSVGEHEIRAELGGLFSGGATSSQAVRHTVLRRTP